MSEEKKAGHPGFYKLLERAAVLHDRKNTDYAGGGQEGPLGNFIRVSHIMRQYPEMDWSTPWGVATVYKLKQLDSALFLASQKRKSVVGEDLEERHFDEAVYSLIQILLKEAEREEMEKTKPVWCGFCQGQFGSQYLGWYVDGGCWCPCEVCNYMARAIPHPPEIAAVDAVRAGESSPPGE